MNGIELIAQERREQIEKHGYKTIDDVVLYSDGALLVAANNLRLTDNELSNMGTPFDELAPRGWNLALWRKMIDKPYNERLVVSGALMLAERERLQAVVSSIASEIDRLQAQEGGEHE